MTARLPDATGLLLTNSAILTTISYSSRWLADARATVRGCRDDGSGPARTRSASDVQNLSVLRNSGCLPRSEAYIMASRNSYTGTAFD